MKIKKTASTLFLIAMLCLGATKAKAQVNAQLFYDFGSDREFVTLTLEMFKQDKWGNTYFFIDHDFNYDKLGGGKNVAPGGTYLEIARCLNFWQKSAIKDLSLQVEYNGGITRSYPINHAMLAGVDYFFHSKDFKNTLNLKALYKYIWENKQSVPMQFTVVWAMNDLFGVKGLMDTNKRLKDAMLFNILSYMSDRLLTIGNTTAALDELYVWLSDNVSVGTTIIEYIRNTLKRVRKKESNLIMASQNLEDFDREGIRELTKPLFAIPPHQFIFNCGSIDKRFYMDLLQLEEAEYNLIRFPQRGVCLFKCGNERYLLEVHAPAYKEALFGTAGGR